MSKKNISLYLWEELKKLHPPKNTDDSKDSQAFESWIKKGINDNAIQWARDFAKHLTNKNFDRKTVEKFQRNENLKKKEREEILNLEFNDDHTLKYNNKKKQYFTRQTLSTSKLRKFFGAVKKIQVSGKFEEDEYRAFKLLMPKLAYDVGREKNKQHKIVDFYFAIKEMSDQVENPAIAQDKKEPQKQFKNFVELLESIVAYFKAYENQIALEEENDDEK